MQSISNEKMILKKYTKNEMTNINKIGIIMWGLLGDVLLRTPVIKSLKEIYPNAKISAIVDPIGKLVLEHNVYVDDIILIERNNNLNKIKGILNIRKENFDLIVNLYNGGSSPLMVFFSNARYKLGFCQQKKKFIYNIKNDCTKDRLKKEQTLSSYMISIIEPLNKKQFSLKPIFTISDYTLKKTKKYLQSFKYDINKIYTLNLGSGDQDKMLENKKYFQLIKHIYTKHNFIPAIISNPGQEYLQEIFIEDFLKPNQVPYIKLNNLALDEVGSIIKYTKFIITPDTGLMHLAMAFDNFIYTIFTYTHPIFVDPKNNNFIAVYEHFDENKLYQHQNILQDTLIDKINLLFSKL